LESSCTRNGRMGGMMTRSFILLVLAAAAIASAYADVPAALRPPLALPFLLVGPGLAWLNRVGDQNVAALAAAAIGLSMAMEVAIGSLLLLCGSWSAQFGFGTLLAVSAAGLLCTERGHSPGSVNRC